MGQLLVRDLNATIIKRLKEQAKLHGVSAEEEHRRILSEALLKERKRKPTLMEHLLAEEFAVESDAELELDRSKTVESRDIGI